MLCGLTLFGLINRLILVTATCLVEVVRGPKPWAEVLNMRPLRWLFMSVCMSVQLAWTLRLSMHLWAMLLILNGWILPGGDDMMIELLVLQC